MSRGSSKKFTVVCGLALGVLCPLSGAHAFTFDVLYAFTGGTAGANPFAGLILDKAGNAYGTTVDGGTGNGVVFEVTPNGAETVLHTFSAPPGDGTEPEAGLLMDKKGNLYGTTTAGGAHGFGTLFKVAPDGTESLLISFAGSEADGCYPQAGLISDSKNNLYGTTPGCSPTNFGTVFKLTPKGKETVLHEFAGGAKDGAHPFASLIADTVGNLYGTTFEGGMNNYGTVFEITARNAATGYALQFAFGEVAPHLVGRLECISSLR